MYKFSYFTEKDPQKIIAFMKAHPFAVVTGFGNDYPVATHLPLAIDITETGTVKLSGHLMKNTDHHKAFEKNERVLVIFNGPHTYVSAGWYQQKNVGSTWNYLTVHAKGKIKFLDEAGTYQAVKSITGKYEAPDSAAAFDKLPKEYVAKLLNAIAGFEIEVISLDNVFKLSQNHDEKDRENIAANLFAKGDDHSCAIAREMQLLVSKSTEK